jgi:hypothetical protein
MDPLLFRQWCIILAHAFIGWAICTLIMGVGMAVTTLPTTLILHAIGGPVGFMILSIIFTKTRSNGSWILWSRRGTGLVFSEETWRRL